MIKRVIIIIISVGLAVLSYAFFHDSVVRIYNGKSSISWGLHLQLYFYIVIAIYTITSILHLIAKRKWLVHTISIILFFIVCISSLSVFPNRTLLVFVSFLVGVACLLIVHLIARKWVIS